VSHIAAENVDYAGALLTGVGPAPQGYPAEAAASYFDGPGALSYVERRDWLLRQKAERPAPPVLKGFYHELARLQLGRGPVHEDLLLGVLRYIDARNDCSDFLMLGITRLLFQFSESSLITPHLLERCRATVLGFKYHPSEPGTDSMCTWTENHSIMFATCDYLHSWMFPDTPFTNTGETGNERVERARQRVCRWLTMRFQTGFSEWLSHVYFDEDIMALLNLVDFAPDDYVRDGARAVLDLIFLELATVVFRGTVATSHGRSYSIEKRYPYLESVADTIYLAFGEGGTTERDNMSAIGLALSQYVCPEAITAVARSNGVSGSRQSCGIRLADAGKWGLDPRHDEDMLELLTLEAYTHPKTIRHFIRLLPRYRWWDNAFFAPFSRYRGLLTWLARLRLSALVAMLFNKDVTRNARERVNVLTVRSPHYQLSCAQDYRAGYGGDQQHIWQAALSRRAVVFTTHPGSFEDGSVSYWTGSGVLPRSVLIDRCVVSIYRLHTRPALYHRNRLMFTHAWFPVAEFDQVETDGNWVFARAGEGYLGLYCSGGLHWYRSSQSVNPGSSPTGPGGLSSSGDPAVPCAFGDDPAPNELRSFGRRAVWICEAGSAEEYADFQTFCQTLAARPVRVALPGVAGPRVRYDSPSAGEVSMSWNGRITSNGKTIATRGYARLDHESVFMPVGATEAAVEFSGLRHTVRLPMFPNPA
jgi:hypothetical protein